MQCLWINFQCFYLVQVNGGYMIFWLKTGFDFSVPRKKTMFSTLVLLHWKLNFVTELTDNGDALLMSKSKLKMIEKSKATELKSGLKGQQH